MKTTAKGGRKNRKHRRNKVCCERYRLEGRLEKNKKRKILRHVKKHPADSAAKDYVVNNGLISKEQLAEL